MRITVVGIGKVGFTVAEVLSKEGHDITVIDRNSSFLQDISGSVDVIGICGSGTDKNILEESNIKECDLLIALTGSDETNLLCCLVAKTMGAKETIARVRSPEYDNDLSLIGDTMGLSMSVNPEREAASEILNILKHPSAKNIDVLANGAIDLISFTVDDRCTMCGKKIKDAFKNPKHHILVCAVRRGNEIYIPDGNFVIQKNDIAAVIAPKDEICDFFKGVGLPYASAKNIMIIGGGRIAHYLAREFDKSRINVTIIEKEPEVAERLSFLFPNTNIICGNGTNRSTLLEEGIAEMDAVVSLTGLDEENIVLSLFAKGLDERIKTIAKVNKTVFHEVMKKLDIGSVVYPKYITANRILRHVRAKHKMVASNLENLYRIIDNEVEALEFRVGENSSLIGQPLCELTIKPNVLIGCIKRDGKIIIPHGDDYIKPNDLVIIITKICGISDIDSIKG
ncbi:MAG: Trk system potassium transporter TrkA [Clostridia bacterium]|nr:Trk system potassium transporter TrkA [Clostridia bacterium]